VGGKREGSGMADKDAEVQQKEDIGTKVMNGVTTMVAAFVARKLLTVVWTKATGRKPPTNPEDPRVALAEALSWSVLVGITVAAVRIFAIRFVSRKALASAHDEAASGHR
jgi:Protein of unknown function (DUF4235)